VALSCHAASSVPEALLLTPNQVLKIAESTRQMQAGKGAGRRRRGTPEEFKAMMLRLAG
jgi:hypothetical protein